MFFSLRCSANMSFNFTPCGLMEEEAADVEAHVYCTVSFSHKQGSLIYKAFIILVARVLPPVHSMAIPLSLCCFMLHTNV